MVAGRLLMNLIHQGIMAFQPGIDGVADQFADRAILLAGQSAQSVQLGLWKQDLPFFHVSSFSMDTWLVNFMILFQNSARRRCEACGVKNRETDTTSALSAL